MEVQGRVGRGWWKTNGERGGRKMQVLSRRKTEE